MQQTNVAIIGSGNIGTDLMVKVMRHGKALRMATMVGVDPNSEGLARASRLGIFATTDGLDGLRSGTGMEISGSCLMPPLRKLINVTPQSSKMTAN